MKVFIIISCLKRIPLHVSNVCFLLLKVTEIINPSYITCHIFDLIIFHNSCKKINIDMCRVIGLKIEKGIELAEANPKLAP